MVGLLNVLIGESKLYKAYVYIIIAKRSLNLLFHYKKALGMYVLYVKTLKYSSNAFVLLGHTCMSINISFSSPKLIINHILIYHI